MFKDLFELGKFVGAYVGLVGERLEEKDLDARAYSYAKEGLEKAFQKAYNNCFVNTFI